MLPPTWASTPTAPTAPPVPDRSPRRIPHGRPVVTAILHTGLVHGLIDGSVCELRFPSPEGRGEVRLPVAYVRTARGELVVPVVAPDRERWWHAFTMPYPLRVYLCRRWRHALGHAVAIGQPGWRRAQRACAERYPRQPLDDGDIFLLITLR